MNTLIIIPITIVDDTILDDNDESLFDSSPVISGIHHNEIDKMNIFKDVVITLENTIAELKEEITFMRKESTEKSDIIQKLIDITKIT